MPSDRTSQTAVFNFIFRLTASLTSMHPSQKRKPRFLRISTRGTNCSCLIPAFIWTTVFVPSDRTSEIAVFHFIFKLTASLTSMHPSQRRKSRSLRISTRGTNCSCLIPAFIWTTVSLTSMHPSQRRQSALLISRLTTASTAQRRVCPL